MTLERLQSCENTDLRRPGTPCSTSILVWVVGGVVNNISGREALACQWQATRRSQSLEQLVGVQIKLCVETSCSGALSPVSYTHLTLPTILLV